MKHETRISRGSGNVFADLGFPNEEAQNLLLRSELMIRIAQCVERSGLTQSRAASQLGLTQPRLNALLKGKIELFSLDALVNVASRAGFQVALRVTPESRKRHGSRAARTAQPSI